MRIWTSLSVYTCVYTDVSVCVRAETDRETDKDRTDRDKEGMKDREKKKHRRQKRENRPEEKWRGEVERRMWVLVWLSACTCECRRVFVRSSAASDVVVIVCLCVVCECLGVRMDKCPSNEARKSEKEKVKYH